jgi:hypothetical protein
MGKTKKVKYVMEVSINTLVCGKMTSQWQQIGLYDSLNQFPNDAKKLRDDYNNSLKPGGANNHLVMPGKAIPYGVNCRVLNQTDYTIPFYYYAPMFEVID